MTSRRAFLGMLAAAPTPTAIKSAAPPRQLAYGAAAVGGLDGFPPFSTERGALFVQFYGADHRPVGKPTRVEHFAR